MKNCLNTHFNLHHIHSFIPIKHQLTFHLYWEFINLVNKTFVIRENLFDSYGCWATSTGRYKLSTIFSIR